MRRRVDSLTEDEKAAIVTARHDELNAALQHWHYDKDNREVSPAIHESVQEILLDQYDSMVNALLQVSQLGPHHGVMQRSLIRHAVEAALLYTALEKSYPVQVQPEGIKEVGTKLLGSIITQVKQTAALLGMSYDVIPSRTWDYVKFMHQNAQEKPSGRSRKRSTAGSLPEM